MSGIGTSRPSRLAGLEAARWMSGRSHHSCTFPGLGGPGRPKVQVCPAATQSQTFGQFFNKKPGQKEFKENMSVVD